MNLTVKTTRQVEEAASFIALAIANQLKSGKHVLFFIPGGSAISVALKVAELLKDIVLKNLTITLTDERYGSIDHFNSNYFQLMEKGFNVGEAKFIPVLAGEDIATTTKNFNSILQEEFMRAEYKIGLFGVGVDGHTAGILPGSMAVNSKDLVASYDTPVFSRITLTPKAIEQLDEAVVWAQGQDKWGVLKDLAEKEIDLLKQPAQILKKVPLLTIFTDM